MRKDIVTMSKKEMERLPIIHKAMEKRITQVKAAEMLTLSDRQVRRLIRKIERGGDQAINHQNRGRTSPFKLSDTKAKEIIAIMKKKYHDFGPTFAAEKLQENEQIRIGREKLRQLMIAGNLWHPYKKQRAIHQWRERKHHYGEMVQMDGSDHDWLESRGPRLDLIGYIDDATNFVYARFYESEGTFSAMDSFQRYSRKYGVPASLYVDRHSAYRTTRQPNLDEDLKGEYAKTQFARALSEVGTKVIFAHSPQAKGRIERTFGTFQDRLVKELRLAGISSLDAANAFLVRYLPKYNASFARPPLEKGDLHKPAPKGLNLSEVFCLKEYRTIGNGFTFHWKNRVFLVRDPSITMKKQRVCVMESFAGAIKAKLKGKTLSITEVTAQEIKAIAEDQKAAQQLIKKERVYFKPPKNHPWRLYNPYKGNLVCA